MHSAVGRARACIAISIVRAVLAGNINGFLVHVMVKCSEFHWLHFKSSGITWGYIWN